MKKKKTSHYAQDCGTIISRFCEITKNLSAQILVEYSSAKTQKYEIFEDNRGGHLMLECDTKSKVIRTSLENELEIENEIEYAGNYAMRIKKCLCDRGIKEMMRIINSNAIREKNYKSKYKEYHRLIDL